MSPRSSSNLSDHAAFSRAYLQHARTVHKVAMAVLDDHARAQDVVQDVFLRLWRRPEAFDARRGALGPFLRVMARSRALDVRREQQAVHRMSDRLRVATEPLTALPDSGYAPEREDIRRALRGLPAGQREALVLTYWGGLTADQIARRSHVPLGTAKSRIRLGLARLRDEFPVAV